MKTKKIIARILFLLFVVFLVFFFVGTHGERKYVYYGEDGYTQYNVIGNDSIWYILYNNGNKPYYIATMTNVTNYSFFKMELDSFVLHEIQVNPGDTVILKKHEEIVDRWKYVDECGHPIPVGDIRCVGCWKNGKFNKY